MEPGRLTIDISKMEKYNLSPSEFLIILASMWGLNLEDLEDALRRMVRNKTMKSELGIITPMPIAKERFYNSITDSTVNMSEESLETLANKMKAIFPKGMKPGTDQFWSEGTKLIAMRLNTFFYKYGMYPEEDILAATQKYVDTKINNPFMRTLRNFIYKDEIDKNGLLTSVSDLYTYLENKDEETESSDQWMLNVK